MSARRTASNAELQAAQALADELRYQAGSRALAAVHRYAGTLVLEAEDANSVAREKLGALGEVLSGLDVNHARTLLEVVEKAEANRLASAQRQAADLTDQIQAALGSLPAPPADFDEDRPRARKSRRRVRKEVTATESREHTADVVELDPSRRRRAN
jgi:hypothetical protein